LLDSYSYIPEIKTATFKSRGGGSVGNIESGNNPGDLVGGGDTGGGGGVVLPFCSDTIDNDSDTYIDILDPNCHLDGNLNSVYVPAWNSETTSPISNTGGGNGGGGGDLGLFRRTLRIFSLSTYGYLQNLLLGLAYNIFK